MKTKICTKSECQKEKPLSEFHKQSSSKDSLYPWCKSCVKNYQDLNKEKIVIQRKKYKDKNKEQIKNQQKEYQRNYRRNRKKIDINFKILCNLRNRLNLAVIQNWKNGRTLELLGCSIKELKKHLQFQFTEDMTWDNYGLWHIDHKIPCAKFDLSKESEQHKCFNYTNLQPLWAIDNFKKGQK